MGSHISGFNLVLKPGEKIVQAWRAMGWWPDYYSVVIFDLYKAGSGTKLKFSQIGVPPSRYSGHYRGWIETYWTPMKEIFIKGAISDQTRAQEIAAGPSVTLLGICLIPVQHATHHGGVIPI